MTCLVRVSKSRDVNWPVGSWINIVRGGYGGSHLEVTTNKGDAFPFSTKIDATSSVRAQVIQPPQGVEFEYIEE